MRERICTAGAAAGAAGMGRVFYVKPEQGSNWRDYRNQIMYMPPLTCRVSPVM